MNTEKPSFNTLILYVRDLQKTCAFYQEYFGFLSTGEIVEGLIELYSPQSGIKILLHQAAKSVKTGQVTVKLIFDVEDIEGFKQEAAEKGLVFGSTHQANGYTFANAKDPDGNSLSISSRAFRSKV
jgi:predicted enzyme related to lactoylglutathione lyase